jgi:hypothetical protein
VRGQCRAASNWRNATPTQCHAEGDSPARRITCCVRPRSQSGIACGRSCAPTRICERRDEDRRSWVLLSVRALPERALCSAKAIRGRGEDAGRSICQWRNDRCRKTYLAGASSMKRPEGSTGRPARSRRSGRSKPWLSDQPRRLRQEFLWPQQWCDRPASGDARRRHRPTRRTATWRWQGSESVLRRGVTRFAVYREDGISSSEGASPRAWLPDTSHPSSLPWSFALVVR